MKIPLKNYHKDFCQKEIIKLYNLNLFVFFHFNTSSNNTNKLSPQEPVHQSSSSTICSNNTNKLSPQEPESLMAKSFNVQIIQINLVLKNSPSNNKERTMFK